MFLKSVADFLLNLVFPPVCPLCHKSIETVNCLCPECYQKLHFITKPYCQVCGRPFEYQGLNELVCGSCLKQKPYYEMARSILEYDDFSRQLILAMKHGGHIELVPLLGKFLLQTEGEFLKDTDIIIPVPLYWSRLLRRGYNQSTLLGRNLGKRFGIPCSPHLLKRVKRTESQGHKTRRDREKNVHNAFMVTRKDAVRGKNILLIDDVMTTGSTINECAKVLKKSGAKTIKVITLYRVITL